MKFTCSRAALSEVLSLLSNVVPARSSKPVLQNILIQGQDDGSLIFSATDLEIGIRYRLEVDDLSDSEDILLPASRFAGIVRDDWSDTVTVSVSDNKAEIITQNGRFHLLGSAADDFPPLQDLDESKAVEMLGEDIINAIDKTLFATARGDVRYALNGIFVHFEKNTVDFVSSDTHRLSLVKKKTRTELENPTDAIVITKGMAELARLSKGQEVVKLQLTTHELIAQTTTATLVARLVDGQFPRYRDVIPRDMEKKVTVSSETLAKTLRLVGQMTNEETHSIAFTAADGKALVSATGSESGDAHVEMEAEIEGGDVAAAFNYHYLLDVLKVLDGDSLSIQFRDSEHPARIDEDDFLHIIMPIKPVSR